MSNRIAGKALSSLTLIIAGTAAASAAPVHSQVNSAESGLNALTAIDLDALRSGEFPLTRTGCWLPITIRTRLTRVILTTIRALTLAI